ncbi:MAG TPA: toll/interleukin-1 receptor domain-containing protein [Bacteroidetes bacterium]|nr:toll/interleukin-1 receptor domain-containing protein [Bacteroidota bacterium]
MSLFNENTLRARFRNQVNLSYYETYETRARNLIVENLSSQDTTLGKAKTYDIFLSHSSSDAELVAGLKLVIEDLGYTVYIDWIEDPKLNRSQVTKATALTLKARMKQCKSLIYAFSENASNSKWMPWELGYFDGIKGTAAVLPISKSTKNDFTGSEYLGIYYYIQIDTISGTDKTALWVYEKYEKYILFDYWLTGSQPLQR